jgi:hypothetical protein
MCGAVQLSNGELKVMGVQDFLFGNQNRGSEQGSGGALVHQAQNAGNLAPNNLMKAYKNEYTPQGVKQIPDLPVPTINRPVLATMAQAIDAESAAKEMNEKVRNGKRVLKAASKLHQASADAVEALGSHYEDCMDAEFQKQQSNAKLGRHAASLMPRYNNEAQMLNQAIQVAQHQIEVDSNRYALVGGWG